MRDDNPFQWLTARSLLFWVFLSIFFFNALATSFGRAVTDPDVALLLRVWLYGSLLTWVMWRMVRLDIDEERLVGRVPPRFPWPAIGGLALMLALFSLGAALVSQYAISLAAPQLLAEALKQAKQAEVLQGNARLLYNIGEALFEILLVPVTQEVVLRGVLLHRWTVKWGVRRAVLATSLLGTLFGPDLFSYFVLFLVMAALYVRMRSLVVPLVCHVLFSLFSLALVVGADSLAEGPLKELRTQAMLGGALLLITAPPLARYLRQNWPADEWVAPYFRDGGNPTPKPTQP
ncbi:MAG TPA: CPBP family intramembrane glutamic endopeptidase [Armatimonadota bacterium]|jgi:hypothetical protein